MNFNTLNESFDKLSEKLLNEDLKYDISGRVEIEKVTGIKFTSIEEESHGSYDVNYTANIQGIADLTVNGIAFDSIPVVAHTGYACYDLEEGTTKSFIREFIIEDLTEGGLDAHYLCDIFDGSLSAEEQEADNFNGSLVFDLRVKNKKDIEKIKRAIELPTQESLLTEKMDNDGFTPEEAEVYWDLNYGGDAILAEFDDFADWYEYLRENNWINEDEVIDDLIIYAEDVLEEYMEMYEGESWHKIVYEAAKKAYECFSERGQDVGPFDKKRMIRIIADGLPSTKKEYLDRFLRLKKGSAKKAIKSYELSKYKNDKLYQSESLQESEIGATAYASYNGPDVYGDGYAVFGYYDEDCRALADSNWCSNWEEVQDLVHSYISKGDVVRIINNETGNDIIVTPDEYFDNFEGDFPIAPQDVEEGHMWNRTAKLDSFDLGLDESLLNEVKGVEYVDSYTIHGIKGELNMSNVDRFTINDIGKYEIINPYLDPRVDDYTAWEYQIELKKVFTADITIMAEEHMQGIDFESHFNNVPVKIDKCCTWIDDEYCDKEDIEYALNQFALNDIIFNIKFPPVSYIESGKFNGNFGEFGCRTSDFRCMGMSIVDDNIIEEINNNLLIKEGLDFYDDSNFNESSLDESIFDEKDYEFEEYEMLDANGDLLMIGRDDYMTDDEAIKYAREHKSPYLQKVKYKASFGSIDYANGLGTIILYDDEIEESINGVKDNGKKPVTEALFDYRTTKDVYGYSANDILQMTEKVLGLSQKEAVKYLNSHSEEDVQAIIDEATKHLYKNAGEKDKYWYFTRHGQGPGTFPRNATLLDWVEDDDFNTWIALDRMLTDEEMAEFELREQTPPDLEEGVLGTALKVAGAVGSVGSAIADAVGSLKEDSEIKPRRKFMGKKSVIKR